MKYLVLGGGPSGLVSAHLLARKFPESRVLLLEKNKVCGGWLKSVPSFSNSGAIFDVGPHSVRAAANNSEFLYSYLKEIQLDKELKFISYFSKANERYLYADRKLIPLKFFSLKSHGVYQRSPLMNITRALFSKPRYEPLSDDHDISVDEFFRTRLGNDFADYMASAMIRGIFAGDSRQLSIKSALPVMEKYDSGSDNFILNFIKNKLAGNIKRVKPSSEVFRALELKESSIRMPYKALAWSPRFGMQQVTDRILHEIGQLPNIQIINEADVISLSHGQDDCHDFQVVYQTPNGEQFVAAADSVFSSLPTFTLKNILPQEAELTEDACAYLATPFANVASCGVELTGSKRGLPQKGFGYLIPTCVDPIVFGVIFDSIGFGHLDGFDEKSGYRTSRFTVMMKGDSFKSNYTVSEQALRVLNEHLNIDTRKQNRPIAFHPQIMNNCIPQYPLNHRRNYKAFTENINTYFAKRTKKGGSFYTFGWCTNGVGVSDAIYSGVERVVDEIRRRQACEL